MPKKLAMAALCAMLLLSGCGASAENECAPAAAGRSDTAMEFAIAEDPAAGAANDGKNLPEAAPQYGTVPADDLIPNATEPYAPSEVSYFTFSRREQSTTDESGQTLLYERYCEPAFYSPDIELSHWINEILSVLNAEFASNSANLLEYAQDYVELNGSEYFYSYSNYQELGITRHDNSVVSLVAVSSLYSGGAHPNAVQTAYNMDVEGRTLLLLEDVIEESSVPALTDMVISGVHEKFEPLGDYALYGDYVSTIEQSLRYGFMTPYWYFNDEGLVVFFNQYELGPYAAGIVKVELSYESLEGILRPEFFPGYGGASHGDLLLYDTEEGARIPITIETDEDKLLIGVEGRVFQIQLSEVFWLEQTPIMQEIIFSAASMGTGDLLEVIGGYTDDGRSFAIEFLDARGARKIYYLSTEGLSEEP